MRPIVYHLSQIIRRFSVAYPTGYIYVSSITSKIPTSEDINLNFIFKACDRLGGSLWKIRYAVYSSQPCYGKEFGKPHNLGLMSTSQS
ncbi:MAG: hypothetical protein RMX68_007865 [Aulosira sp. ZfuVER01]|nr:hypothetical protein [Aulosira sp. DedVER01a]MDZ8053679.1 hypothetical protein [Aulosira sp. ZfuCHP01]